MNLRIDPKYQENELNESKDRFYQEIDSIKEMNPRIDSIKRNEPRLISS